MTDLSITASSVKWTGGVPPKLVKAGATITRGQTVYRDTSDNEYKLGDCDADATSEIAGIALTDGYDGSDMLIGLPGSQINIGATTVAGTGYWQTGTAGGIGATGEATPTSGDYRVLLFIGSGTGVVTLVLAKGATVIP